MAVYFITGKLGSGKTLVSIGKIRDTLNKGCKVATNIDLNLHKLISSKSKNSVVYRIPDKPTLIDLENIGIGNTTYNEEKNGLLVLDECGTWFNSRSWGDKSRQDVINWFLHARKLGWDIIFLVQDISIVDKQAREALAEHVVYCRRLDRVGIPFVSALLRVAGVRVNLPKAHLAIVKYGHMQSSMILERWIYTGKSLYNAYDTKQAFSDNYDNSVYQLLPPFYSHHRYLTQRNLRFYMRLTKIYLKRFNRPLLALVFFVAGFLFSSGFLLVDLVNQKKDYELNSIKSTKQATSFEKTEHIEPQKLFNLKGAKIISYSKLGDFENYNILTNTKEKLTSNQLKAKGYTIELISPCMFIIKNGDEIEEIKC